MKKTCKYCKATNVTKFGKVPTAKSGVKQRYRCNKCGRTMY